jgi:hypothetical protein
MANDDKTKLEIEVAIRRLDPDITVVASNRWLLKHRPHK